MTYNDPTIQMPPDAAQVRPDPTVGDPPSSRVPPCACGHPSDSHDDLGCNEASILGGCPCEGFEWTEYAYWNTPDDDGVTRRQRKWAKKVGVEPTNEALAALPCLGGAGPVVCRNGSCVTCEARKRKRVPASESNDG